MNRLLLHKLKNKSLITNADIEFNIKYGLPVEVFCPAKKQTLAFGRIEDYNHYLIQINGVEYCRNQNALFGHPSLSA
ncbi:hypothetical protein [Alkalihalobacterium sp. APHAB7]|uniref:hypothetical protein n=1 Tax=Alkalihalobacterium sp. APHAB7 TaxID=3402081 RepID=UPI003AAAD088